MGKGLTVTVTFAVLVQPFPSVPVTVYVVVVVGLTKTEVPESNPGIHEYVTAPPPVKEVEVPAQIVGFDATAFTVGKGFTVTLLVPTFIHPFRSVTVTE